jgi:hypothetical protein
MKTVALTALTVLLTSLATVSVARADTLCGELQMRVISPVCLPDQMCAQYFRQAHILANGQGEIELQTANYDLLTQLVQDVGSNICVEGQQAPATTFFNVTQITGPNQIN